MFQFLEAGQTRDMHGFVLCVKMRLYATRLRLYTLWFGWKITDTNAV